MLYISDIYNVVSQKHFKYIDPNIKPQDLYCVATRFCNWRTKSIM